SDAYSLPTWAALVRTAFAASGFIRELVFQFAREACLTLYFIDVMHPNQSTHVSQLRQAQGSGATTLEVTVMSFGYKEGPPPLTNMVFDVRFLKNPFWIAELRPLSGLDQPVQDYVVKQALAREFLDSLLILLNSVLPRFAELELTDFSIAFGCTGGQH